MLLVAKHGCILCCHFKYISMFIKKTSLVEIGLAIQVCKYLKLAKGTQICKKP